MTGKVMVLRVKEAGSPAELSRSKLPANALTVSPFLY